MNFCPFQGNRQWLHCFYTAFNYYSFVGQKYIPKISPSENFFFQLMKKQTLEARLCWLSFLNDKFPGLLGKPILNRPASLTC